MSNYLQGATICCILTATLGCSTSVGFKAWEVQAAVQSSLVDPRVGQKNINTSYGKYEAVTVDVYKDPVSEQAAHAAEVIVPELASAIVKALIAHGALSAIGSLGDAFSDSTETFDEATETFEAGSETVFETPQ